MNNSVTIAIPVFNGLKYLPECIQSLLQQTDSDFDVVIIDDGSYDGTEKYCDHIHEVDARFNVVHKENEGLLFARKRAIAEAKGDYIVFLDADDALSEDAVAVIKSSFESNQADILIFDYSRQKNLSVGVSGSRHLAYGTFADSSLRNVYEAICRGGLNNLCTKAFRRDLFSSQEELDDYKGLMHGEDLLQLLPLVDRAKRICHIPDILYFYRVNALGSTATFRESQLDDLDAVFSSAERYANKWGAACEQCVQGAVLINLFWPLRNAACQAAYTPKEKRRIALKIQDLIEKHDGKFDESNPDLRIDIKVAMSLLLANKVNLALVMARLSGYLANLKSVISSL